jgi:hypothetical protein
MAQHKEQNELLKLKDSIKIACIGPTTKEAFVDFFKQQPHILPKNPAAIDLINAIFEYDCNNN